MARPRKSKAVEVATLVAEQVKDTEEVVAEVIEDVSVEEETVETEEKKTKKAPAKRVKKETTITLEFGDYTANMAVVEERVRAQFVADGHKASEIKVLNIYVKPFENSAYYVINETETGRVDLF